MAFFAFLLLKNLSERNDTPQQVVLILWRLCGLLVLRAIDPLSSISSYLQGGFFFIDLFVLVTIKIKLANISATDSVTPAMKHFQVAAECSTFHLKPAIFRHLEV